MAKNRNGYWFAFEDGENGWTAGWTAWEKKQMIAKHGKLIKWVAA